MMTKRSISFLLALTLSAIMLIGCTNGGGVSGHTDAERDAMEAEVKLVTTPDSLERLAQRYADEENVLGQLVALRYLGRLLLNENHFDQAIRVHRKAMYLAGEVCDTLEMVDILNHLGTSHRRIGELTEASSYHLQALSLSRQMADKNSERVKKSLLVSLNGLGNVYLFMDRYEQADTVLRQALAGEQELGSDLGQAINLANLGTIKEHLGQTDSAWYYYREAMQKNQQCHSQVGMSLCHVHYGELYESRDDLDSALREYQTAYDLMADSQDEWHRLEALLHMGGVYVKGSRIAQAKDVLDKAQETALRIGSVEHQAEIQRLYYELYEKTGDPRRAHDYYVLSEELEDSMLNMAKLNEIQHNVISLERELRQRELTLAQENLELERSQARMNMIAFAAFMLLAVGIIVFLWYHLHVRTRTQRIMRQVQHSREIFFTSVTHEFRTPLTVILGLGRQLEDTSAGNVSQVKSAAKMIVRQGNALLLLINQLLDISKVRSAIGDPKWRRGDIVTYVGMIVENFQPYAQSKRQELTYTHTRSLIEMDFVPDYVKRIVSNLISNAIKFTPQYGRIHLTLEHVQDDQLRIQVLDTGRGIDKETLPEVFEPFVQGKQLKGDIGTGVGLALVKMMAEAMGGSVSAESTEGKGSTFSVLLPMKHADNVQPLSEMELEMNTALDNVELETVSVVETHANGEDEAAVGSAAAASSVLIVEDNQDIAYYIGMHLKGYRLLYARGAAEGWQKVQEMMPDLIITDLMMPGEMDGLELCRCVRMSELTSHIPIIIVTAKTTEDDHVKGLQAGADAYLVKPFNSEELLVRVQKLIEQRRLLRDKFAQDIPKDGEKKQQDLTAQDRQFMNRLLDTVHSLMPHGRTDLDSVAERMDMSRSQLCRKTMAVTGQSPAVYIMRLRLVYAKRLLKSDVTLPIGNVAQRCGFEDVAYFSRIFKQQFDMTPSQYRKSE